MQELIEKLMAELIELGMAHYHVNNHADVHPPKGFYVRLGTYAQRPCVRFRPVGQTAQGFTNLLCRLGYDVQLRPDYWKFPSMDSVYVYESRPEIPDSAQ